MDLLVVIGDQDTYHETEEEIVASPRWLADILTDEGMTGLFALHARRAEILAEQGRHDVIAALRRHEIGLHGRDIHPNIPEQVEGMGWEAGVDSLLASEGAELEMLGRVFEVAPVCMSEHRGLGAPQIFPVSRQLGMPYLFGFPAAPPHHSVSWYAGALNVPFDSPVPDFLGFFPAVFDDVLADDASFANLHARLGDHIDRALAAGLPLLSVFVCHPERLCYSGPLEQWQYGNGRNHGRAAVPPGVEVRRSQAEIDRALTNVRTLLRSLRETPGLEPVTVAEVGRRYGQQAEQVGRAELLDLATRALADRQIPIGATVSPTQTLLAFAHALATVARGGGLPEQAPCVDALGPITAPPLALETPSLACTDLPGVMERLMAHWRESGGHLPPSIQIDGRALGLGALYGALAEGYRRVAHGQPLGESLTLGAWPRYPEPATALGARVRRCAEDPLVRPGLTTDAIALHAQLQTWSLKPAQRT